jgi:hypothetical protein
MDVRGRVDSDTLIVHNQDDLIPDLRSSCLRSTTCNHTRRHGDVNKNTVTDQIISVKENEWD